MFLGGWALMIGLAMIPGTLPVMRLVAGTRGATGTAAFLGGYVGSWLALGVVGFLALSPFAPALEWVGAGALLAVTAAYELSPLKDACLRRCRSPLRILLHGSFTGGVRHAVDCAGCCALLMLLMVALDLMSVAWIALLAGVVFLQKAAPLGRRSAPALAFGLGTAAVATWI